MHPRFALYDLLLIRRGMVLPLIQLVVIWGVVIPLTFAVEPAVDSFRPSSLSGNGSPPVSDELMEALARYQNIRGASFAGFSPTGEGMLVRTRFGNTAQLHRVYLPGGRRQQITFFREPVRGNFVEHADDDAILLSKSAGGNEQDQVVAFDSRTRIATLLTDGKSRNSRGPMSPDGKRVVIHSTMRNGRDTDVYLSDCRTGNTLRPLVETDGEYWFCTDWSPDGETLLAIQYVSANESYLGTIDVASGKLTRQLIPGQVREDPANRVSISAAAFAPDGKSILIATDVGREFRQLARFTPATGLLAWLAKDIEWNVEDIVVSPSTSNVAVVVNANGASELYVFDDRIVATAGLKKLTVPLAIVNNLDFSPAGDKLGMTLSTANGGTDVYSTTLDGELTRWTFSELGGLNPSRFLSPERIQFESFDARVIPAYYYRPAAATADAPAAVVINIHGGPEGQYRPYLSPSTQYYAGELGIAVIAPNVRGSAGYGKTYLKLDNGPRREDSVRDIAALLDWISEREELDGNRVIVTGGSYGGYMVLATLTHYSDRLAGGIDRVGIANFVTFLERTKPYRRDLRRAEYGDERDPEMRAVFERINPTANAHQIKVPLMIVHGENDPRVPFFEAQQIEKIVRNNGVAVWTLYADNEGHGFRKKDNRDYQAAVEAMFVKKVLQNAEE